MEVGMDKDEFCKVCGDGILFGYATVCDSCKAKGYDEFGRKKKRKTRGEVHAGPDRFGAYTYSLHWLADYHPGDPAGEHRTAERGQYFYGDPAQHKDVSWEDKRSIKMFHGRVNNETETKSDS
jgi:hypothetical protein